MRIDMDQRERHMAEKRLAREMEQYRAVLADRPEHAKIVEGVVGLADDINAFIFQTVQMILAAAHADTS